MKNNKQVIVKWILLITASLIMWTVNTYILIYPNDSIAIPFFTKGLIIFLGYRLVNNTFEYICKKHGEIHDF